jgi:aryl-alcohol dehydrogenase-like predicted oxidoreductase
VRQIKLVGTELSVSRFIFGTASLFNAGSKTTRYRILESAVDNGFTHFDTAPLYGFGMAEKDLSRILVKYCDVSVTSKVGIYAPGGEEQVALSIFLRKVAGKVAPRISSAIVDFSLTRARESLEGSLRRLGRDCIDIYTLHEPDLDLVATDEWLKWLERIIVEGKVMYFGLATTREKLEPFLINTSSLTGVIQMLDSLDRKEADILEEYRKPFQITYGYISAARSRGNQMTVQNILTHALMRNKQGAIIVSTKRVERLGQYQKILENMTC